MLAWHHAVLTAVRARASLSLCKIRALLHHLAAFVWAVFAKKRKTLVGDFTFGIGGRTGGGGEGSFSIGLSELQHACG